MLDSKPSDEVKDIPFCDTIPDWALRSYLESQAFRDAVDRSIEPPRQLLPPGWKTDWFGWKEKDDLLDLADRSATEIFLQGMFDMVFPHVQLIMYDTDSPDEPIVLLYHGRFYKYIMGEQELFVYPDRYTTVEALLQNWETAESDLIPVAEIRDERYCTKILYRQLGLRDVYEAEVHRRWGRNYRDHSEWFRTPRDATWRQLWVHNITGWLSHIFRRCFSA
ncbi:hypothetical protein C8J56DRAFT_465910 [Mycena floridula]|nr:hypothetical protein C8J56DRAFT_465910 [Mycena floridula]